MKNTHSLLGLAACLCFTLTSRGQNLVNNPSFEAIQSGQTINRVNELNLAEGWSSPTAAAPQLYTTINGTIYDPNGALWPFKARTGANVAGINVYGGVGKIQRREYIQGSLASPLTVGKKYYFTFYVHYHCEGANNIGIAFLPEPMHSAEMGLVQLQPVSYQKAVTPYNNTDNTWAIVRDSFVAARPFQSFIIGNFLPNESTQVESRRYSHYFAYIDDIEVVEARDAVQTLSVEEEKKWAHNEATAEKVAAPELVRAPEMEEMLEDVEYREEIVRDAPQAPSWNVPKNFPPVLFNNGSQALDAEAETALNKLIDIVSKNPAVKSVQVIGYASSEGSQEFNKRLSEKRAEAVKAYLQQKGLDIPVSVEGKGTSNPIGDNGSEEGRKANRRVEIILGF